MEICLSVGICQPQKIQRIVWVQSPDILTAPVINPLESMQMWLSPMQDTGATGLLSQDGDLVRNATIILVACFIQDLSSGLSHVAFISRNSQNKMRNSFEKVLVDIHGRSDCAVQGPLMGLNSSSWTQKGRIFKRWVSGLSLTVYSFRQSPTHFFP